MKDFEFNIEKVKPMFEASGFNTVENRRNLIRLESTKVTVTIAFDERENSNLCFVGRIGTMTHLLHNGNLREVFNYDKTPADFTDFLLDFLNSEGKGILKGDLDKLHELEEFEERQAKIYTSNLLREQRVRAADNAWTNKDYLTFVKEIDGIDLDHLPESYKLKYKIACDLVRETK